MDWFFTFIVFCLFVSLALMVGFPLGAIFGRRRALSEIEYCDCDCHVPQVVQAAQSRLDSRDVLSADIITEFDVWEEVID